MNRKIGLKKISIFDSEVKNNFSDLEEDALFGYLNNWHRTLDGCAAFIILTDQFTRNIFTGTPRSFSGDKLALKSCLHFFVPLTSINKLESAHTLFKYR